MSRKAFPSELPISRYMTRSPISVDAAAGIPAAAALMRLNGFQHLPVTRAGEVLGVVSARDLLAFDAVRAPGMDALRVGDLARTDLYAVSSDAPLGEVLTEMVKRGIGSALVADGTEVIGIFTASDALRVFADLVSRTTGV